MMDDGYLLGDIALWAMVTWFVVGAIVAYVPLCNRDMQQDLMEAMVDRHPDMEGKYLQLAIIFFIAASVWVPLWPVLLMDEEEP